MLAETQVGKISQQMIKDGYQQRPMQNDEASSGQQRRRNQREDEGHPRQPPHQHNKQPQHDDPQDTSPNALAEPALKSLILTPRFSQLQTQQRTRRLEAAHPVVQALRTEAVFHQSKAVRRRKLIASRAPGDAAATITQSLLPVRPPDIAFFGTPIVELAKQDIGEVLKQKLGVAAQRANAMEQAEMLATVQMSRIYPTANFELSKISSMAQKKEPRTLTLAALASLKDDNCMTAQARPSRLEEVFPL